MDMSAKNSLNPDLKLRTGDICPYCKNKLLKTPSRKTKCEHCKQEIYVRSKQKIFDYIILTKIEAEVIDRLTVLSDYYKDYFGIENIEDIYNNKKAELGIKFNCIPQASDILWGIYNDLILNNKSLDFIYRQMSYFAEAEGKNPKLYYELAYNNQKKDYMDQLLGYKKVGLIKQVIIFSITDGDCCDYCKKLDGKKMSLDEAIQNMPIPYGNCKSGFCRCIYSPIFEGDKLIYKSNKLN